jgi:hypothetical protein
MLVTSLWAAEREPIVRTAADILCQDLKRKLTGERPSDRYFRAIAKLGEDIATGHFAELTGIETQEILMPYANEAN